MLRHPVRFLMPLLVLSLTLTPAAHARRAPSARATTPAPAPVAVPAAPAAPPAPALLSLPVLSPLEEFAISRPATGLVPFRLANGAVGLDLQGRFQEFAMVRVAPDGRLVFNCVDDATTLRRLLAAPVAAAPVTAPLEDR